MRLPTERLRIFARMKSLFNRKEGLENNIFLPCKAKNSGGKALLRCFRKIKEKSCMTKLIRPSATLPQIVGFKNQLWALRNRNISICTIRKACHLSMIIILGDPDLMKFRIKLIMSVKRSNSINFSDQQK